MVLSWRRRRNRIRKVAAATTMMPATAPPRTASARVPGEPTAGLPYLPPPSVYSVPVGKGGRGGGDGSNGSVDACGNGGDTSVAAPPPPSALRSRNGAVTTSCGAGDGVSGCVGADKGDGSEASEEDGDGLAAVFGALGDQSGGGGDGGVDGARGAPQMNCIVSR